MSERPVPALNRTERLGFMLGPKIFSAAHARSFNVDDAFIWNQLFAAMTVTALCHHVCRIIRSGAEEQMRRSNAAPIVTFVQDEHPVLDGSVRYFVRHAVRMGVSTRASNFDLPIAMSERSGPVPARFGLVNLLPKAFRHAGTLAHFFRWLTMHLFFRWRLH
jgi:hypothetical protein